MKKQNYKSIAYDLHNCYLLHKPLVESDCNKTWFLDLHGLIIDVLYKDVLFFCLQIGTC